MKHGFARRLIPSGRQGWIRFTFYALETLVIGMTAKGVPFNHIPSQPMEPGPWRDFADQWSFVYFCGFVGLWIISIRIKSFCPIHSLVGLLTLALAVLHLLGTSTIA